MMRPISLLSGISHDDDDDIRIVGDLSLVCVDVWVITALKKSPEPLTASDHGIPPRHLPSTDCAVFCSRRRIRYYIDRLAHFTA